jgi:hypothetical protein
MTRAGIARTIQSPFTLTALTVTVPRKGVSMLAAQQRHPLTTSSSSRAPRLLVRILLSTAGHFRVLCQPRCGVVSMST